MLLGASTRALSLAADGVLLIHAAFVAFVIGGLLLTWTGRLRRWHWVGHPAFRFGHLAAIGVVAAQAVLGWTCPLTTLEVHLRRRAGVGPVYQESFMEHWVGRLLFHNAESWIFTTAYIAFLVLVLASFWFVPVRWRRHDRSP